MRIQEQETAAVSVNEGAKKYRIPAVLGSGVKEQECYDGFLKKGEHCKKS
ncbi:hypothetical protein B4100_2290 [Heyndrickxia coagulans]|nr:hypothetical protein B4100_2290 [Heyndrickxia coagulans]